MKIENINIHSLPSLIIPERFNLPEVGAVYFVLSENNEVEYIGKAKKLYKRWRKHECCIDMDSPKTCRVAWIEVADEIERVEIEKQFIISIKPRLNSQNKSAPKPIINSDLFDSEKLIWWRENLGLSRIELARELKITYATVFRWENKNREIPPYLELALEEIERKLKNK